MPLIQIFTSAAAPAPAARDALLRDLSHCLSSHFDKAERWVMTCLLSDVAMTFGATKEPSCFAAVKNVGALPADRAARLCEDLCTRLSVGLGVPKDRVYLEFTEAEGRLWGWNSETFE